MPKNRHSVAILATVVGALAGAPAAAVADMSVSGFTVVPSTMAAGAHPDVAVTETFVYRGGDGMDTAKSTTLHFPAGLLGNPKATEKCSETDFSADACPANTQVGTISVNVSVLILAIPIPISPAPTGSVYNLVSDASHPATLGIVIRPPIGDKIFLRSPISLRTSSDFGIDSPVDDMPKTALGLPLRTDQVTLTLLGTPPGASAPFMSNPTSCKPATTTFDAVSYEAPDKTATSYNTFTPTGCDKLPFAPAISATMGAAGATASGSHVPFQATITQPVGEAAQLNTTVTLPASLAPATNSVSAFCSADELAATACPAEARIGTATISSPLLPAPVQGPTFAVQRPAQLPGVGIEFAGPFPFVLGGASSITPDLRLQNVFTGLPDVPLTTFTLAIDGGPRGLLAANRDLCTGPTPTVIGSFTGQNRATSTATAPVTVNGCAAPRLASPRAKGTLRGLLGGHPRLTVTVLKGAAALRRVALHLPHDLRVQETKRGVNAVGASFTLGKRSIRLSRKGTLLLKLPRRGASRVTATLDRGSIVGSPRLRAQLKKHPSVKLKLTIRTLDTRGRRTTLHLRLTGKR